VTYFRLNQFKEARAPLEKAAALRPEFYGSVVLLGATLYMLGDDAAALPVLERAHRLNPADAQTAAVLAKLRPRAKKQQTNFLLYVCEPRPRIKSQLFCLASRDSFVHPRRMASERQCSASD